MKLYCEFARCIRWNATGIPGPSFVTPHAVSGLFLLKCVRCLAVGPWSSTSAHLTHFEAFSAYFARGVSLLSTLCSKSRHLSLFLLCCCFVLGFCSGLSAGLQNPRCSRQHFLYRFDVFWVPQGSPPWGTPSLGDLPRLPPLGFPPGAPVLGGPPWTPPLVSLLQGWTIFSPLVV